MMSTLQLVFLGILQFCTMFWAVTGRPSKDHILYLVLIIESTIPILLAVFLKYDLSEMICIGATFFAGGLAGGGYRTVLSGV